MVYIKPPFHFTITWFAIVLSEALAFISPIKIFIGFYLFANYTRYHLERTAGLEPATFTLAR
jgi:hypothetical protein